MEEGWRDRGAVVEEPQNHSQHDNVRRRNPYFLGVGFDGEVRKEVGLRRRGVVSLEEVENREREVEEVGGRIPHTLPWHHLPYDLGHDAYGKPIFNVPCVFLRVFQPVVPENEE